MLTNVLRFTDQMLTILCDEQSQSFENPTSASKVHPLVLIVALAGFAITLVGLSTIVAVGLDALLHASLQLDAEP